MNGIWILRHPEGFGTRYLVCQGGTTLTEHQIERLEERGWEVSFSTCLPSLLGPTTFPYLSPAATHTTARSLDDVRQFVRSCVEDA